jgi:hypothetical protein
MTTLLKSIALGIVATGIILALAWSMRGLGI